MATITYDFDTNNDAQTLDTAQPSSQPAMGGLAAGGFVGLASLPTNNLFASVYSTNGFLTRGTSLTNMTDGNLAQLQDGRIVVVGETGAALRVVGLASDGLPISGFDFALGNGTVANPDIAALKPGGVTGGGFAVAYERNGSIRVDLFNSTPQLQTLANITVPGGGALSDPAITVLNNGTVVVACTRTINGESEIVVTMLDPLDSGAIVFGPTVVDTDGTINRDVDIVATPNGGFALVYEDNEFPSAGTGTTLARYDANGTLIGKGTLSQEFSEDRDPSIAVLSNGFLAVADARANALPFVRLIDPTTGQVLAERDVIGSFQGSDPADTAIASFGVGRVAVYYGDGTDPNVSGSAFRIVRNWDNLGFEETVTGDDLIDNVTGGFSVETINTGRGDDIIRGGGSFDIINAGDGDDTIFTGDGNDPSELTSGGNARGGEGKDTITGTLFRDSLFGDGGDDVLDGGIFDPANAGDDLSDRLDGGLGRDTVTYATALQSVTITLTNAVGGHTGATVGGGATGDTLVDIENLDGSNFGDALTGNNLGNFLRGLDGADSLNGGAGNDTLDGNAGADVMSGGADSDTYMVDDAGDVTTEALNAGTDLVQSSVSQALRANVENLTLTGTGNTNGTGNSLVNLLVGNVGNNILDGGTGADAMRGGGGNDRYTFDNAGDTASELVGEGTDTVISSVAHTLRPNFENLTIIGTATNAFGSSVANILTGNALNNILNGKEANDIMTGGAGPDTFIFDTALGATNVDRITDFNPVDDAFRLDDAIFSTLPLGTLAAGAFHAGTAAAEIADRIIYDQATGRVFYDADGLGGTAQVLFALLDTKPANLSHIDFVVA